MHTLLPIRLLINPQNRKTPKPQNPLESSRKFEYNENVSGLPTPQLAAEQPARNLKFCNCKHSDFKSIAWLQHQHSIKVTQSDSSKQPELALD